MTDQLERRVHDLEEIVGTLASWLVAAQTGFGQRDAEGIWDLIDKSRSAAQERTPMSDGPTIYARLMDDALAEPEQTIKIEMELFIRGSGIDVLTGRVCEMLKMAYVAGVRDGYTDAVMKDAAAAAPTKEENDE